MLKMLLTAISVTAFAMMDKMKKGSVAVSAVGGVLTYIAEYLLVQKNENYFIVCFLSASVTCVYSEIMARVKKMPATVIMMPAVIPLVPGSLIYYSMKALLENNYQAYIQNLTNALLSAGGIATAAAFVGALAGLFKRTVELWLARLSEVER